MSVSRAGALLETRLKKAPAVASASARRRRIEVVAFMVVPPSIGLVADLLDAAHDRRVETDVGAVHLSVYSARLRKVVSAVVRVVSTAGLGFRCLHLFNGPPARQRI